MTGESGHFWELPLADLLAGVGTSSDGLSADEAAARLKRYGPNQISRDKRFAGLLEFLRFFANPLVATLLVAAVVSFFLGERIDAVIIVAIVLMSVVLDFFQVYQARKAVEDLRGNVALTATVVRDGAAGEQPVVSLVPGDVIRLNAGDIVPADSRLTEAKDLLVRESALTGESVPVSKSVAELGGPSDLSEAVNSVFLGTSVQSGIGTAVVVKTGRETEFGAIAAELASGEPETEFDRGIKNFGLLLVRVIMLLVLFVFLVNVVHHRSAVQAFLFALALAVGLTPELLPVILTVTLANGAKRMAKRGVIVKQLASIENFGSIEILCSDKTGTLTLGEVTLERYVDASGADSDDVLFAAYLNASLEAAMSSPLDQAVLAHDHPDAARYSKVDEVPFDFDRRRVSVIVARGEETTLIAKGAAEDVLSVCTEVATPEGTRPLDAGKRETAETTYRELSEDGFRVLAVASKAVERKAAYDRGDEAGLTLLGFVGFLDPPKEGVSETLKALEEDGISIVIMTGDNAYVTKKIASEVGLPTDTIITGKMMAAMDDASLAVKAEGGAIFAQVSPAEKNRVMTALKHRGRVVGFLGDGINDAPSMNTADIGISVTNAVDVAKDAANIILVEKDLGVLHAGVIEGRRSFANIMKYIIMGTSSNFGNMFSMAGASLFLPFLPMLPAQILLNNLLYDLSQIAIPSDNVDEQLLRRPKRWRTAFIRQFMLIVGPISSIYDFLMFAVLLLVFRADQTLFHTGWFVESLATQTLVVFIIRTSGNPFKSRPSRRLIGTVLAVVVGGAVLPYTPLGKLAGFTPMPVSLLALIGGLALTYLLIVQAVKQWFYRRHELI